VGYTATTERIRGPMKQVVVEQTYKLVSYTLIVPLLGCGSSTAKSSAAPSATYAVVAAPETRETSTLPSAVQIVLKRAPDSERHMLALGIKNVSHRPLVINLGNNFNPTSVAISIWGADAGELAWRFVGGGIAPGRSNPFVALLRPARLWIYRSTLQNTAPRQTSRV
jgi:hypothetical protein